MNRSELEKVLELAERRDTVAEELERVRQLEVEIERDVAVELAVPDLIAVIEQRTAAIAAIARELEREWSAQGPLVLLWTRAAEQLQQAETAGVDPEPYRAEVAAAERRVEAARLETRDHRELLEAERNQLLTVVERLPVEMEPPIEPRDDARPEALRRDALALIETGDLARELLQHERDRAAAQLAVARAELSRRGSAQELEREIADINARLPAEVELPSNAPPSMEMRLRRVGISVTAGARE